MSSNSVCNHTCDWDIRLLLHVCLILLITRMIADQIGLWRSVLLPLWIEWHKFYYHSINTVTKFEKQNTSQWKSIRESKLTVDSGRKGNTYSRHIGVLQKLSSWCTNQTAWNKSHWHFVLVSVPCAHVFVLATAFSCLVSNNN